MELPYDFPINPRRITPTKYKITKGMWLLFGLRDHRKYSYTNDDVRTIWGFYNGKKGEYYAPINAKKAGDVVDINDTRNYTAMQLNLKGLEGFFI